MGGELKIYHFFLIIAFLMWIEALNCKSIEERVVQFNGVIMAEL